jgi:transposase
LVCIETRHIKAFLTAQQINKSDRNDARGITQMMRVDLFKPVHVKTQLAQEQCMLSTSRKLLQRRLLDVECDLHGTLRTFGLKVGMVSTGKFEARVRELVIELARLALIELLQPRYAEKFSWPLSNPSLPQGSFKAERIGIAGFY